MQRIFQRRLFEGPKEVGEVSDGTTPTATPEVPPAAQPAKPKSIDDVNPDVAATTMGGVMVETLQLLGGVDKKSSCLDRLRTLRSSSLAFNTFP